MLCEQQRKVAGELTGIEKEKVIINEAGRLEIRDMAPLVLAELLYDSNILEQIKQYRTLMYRVSDAANASWLKFGIFQYLLITSCLLNSCDPI
jgi:translation initiation factor 5